jgi:hypothetical protein
MYDALGFFGIVFSLFYGAHATTIWFRFPEFPDPGKAIDRKQAWLEGWLIYGSTPATCMNSGSISEAPRWAGGASVTRFGESVGRPISSA